MVCNVYNMLMYDIYNMLMLNFYNIILDSNLMCIKVNIIK